MKTLKRGDKIYLDKENTKESVVNTFIESRDAIVQVIEYKEPWGYSNNARLFLCEDCKHEVVEIVNQSELDNGEWHERSLSFSSDEFSLLRKLIDYDNDLNSIHTIDGEHTYIRDYTEGF